MDSADRNGQPDQIWLFPHICSGNDGEVWPACPVHATATIDDEKIQGTYATVDCPVGATGTFTLTRQ